MIHAVFWMKAFTSRDVALTASSGELHSEAAFHAKVRQAGRTGVWGWLSACSYASGWSQSFCSRKWRTGPLGTALKERSLFSALDLVKEKEVPWSIRIAAGPKNIGNIELKMTSKCVFIFGNPATFLMLSLSLSMCLLFVWKLLMLLADRTVTYHNRWVKSEHQEREVTDVWE